MNLFILCFPRDELLWDFSFFFSFFFNIKEVKSTNETRLTNSNG